MAKPLKIPLCLAITLGVCLSVITTDAIPNAATYAQDAIVPEEELSQIDTTDLSHFTGLTQQPASATLRAKVCDDGHVCTFHVELDSVGSEQDNEHLSGNAVNQMKVEFYLVVSPGPAASTAEKTFDLSCKNFHESDTNLATGKEDNTVTDAKSPLMECLELSTRSIIQRSDGSLEMMVAEQNPNEIDRDDKCDRHMLEIQNIFAGTLAQLAGVYASADDESLIQFSETVQDANGKRTTHYRREKHENGSMTVHRRHSWELEAPKYPQPVLMQGGQESLTLVAAGHNNVDVNGISTASREKITAKIGAKSPKSGFSCTPSETPDADGKSCNTEDAPASAEKAQTIRLKNESNEQITLVTKDATELVQKPTLNEFLQEHAAAGRIRTPLLKALRATSEKQPVDPVKAEQVFAAFVEFLEQAKPSDFEPGQLRNKIARSMESPKMRRLTVDKLSKNQIKNGRAVQSLMHAIGRAGTQQVEAIDQLIELGGSASVNEDARSQAIVALLQAKCYNHDYAIRRLAMLAKPNPQTHMQIMSLHVQHALIAHAEHCANNKYTDASANKYDDILSQSRKHLADAAANKDDGATWILLDAIGNTNSQSPRETEAVASVANNNQLAAQTRLLAVRTLGRLYTNGALAALRKLSSSSDSDVQKAAEEAIAGKHLHMSDARKPPPGEVSTMPLAQSRDKAGSRRLLWYRRRRTTPAPTAPPPPEQSDNLRAKEWTFPAGSDISAQPAVGVKIYKDNDGAGGFLPTGKFCLHGYAAVNGKAWSYEVELVKAGAIKCVGYKFYKYLSILGQVFYSKETGDSGLETYDRKEKEQGNFNSREAPKDQFSTGGVIDLDRQGYCGTDVDKMNVGTIAYDYTFLDQSHSVVVMGVTLTGTIKVSGEVGVKAGWGDMTAESSSDARKAEDRCKSGGSIVFAIPYAQATVKGTLEVDAWLAKGGASVEVTLAKFSLPATCEWMSDTTCGNVFLKAESLGGKVVAYVDVMSGLDWWGYRTWASLGSVILHDWTSPGVWKSNELQCIGAASGASSTSESR